MPNLKRLVHDCFKYDGPISILILELSLPIDMVDIPFIMHVVQACKHYSKFSFCIGFELLFNVSLSQLFEIHWPNKHNDGAHKLFEAFTCCTFIEFVFVHRINTSVMRICRWMKKPINCDKVLTVNANGRCFFSLFWFAFQCLCCFANYA
jgi:hypothetical protein